jgi:hypothetical protein
MFASIGFTHIVVDSIFFEGIRKLFPWLSDKMCAVCKKHWIFKPFGLLEWLFEKIHYMLTCYQCAGFWCGLFTGLILLDWSYAPFPETMPWYYDVLVLIMSGFASSFLAQWGAYYLTYLESKTVVEFPDE